MSIVRLPGLIDVHVHLREPGGVQKEDLSSGSAAALAGGFTLVLDMPNNTPPTVDAATLAAKKQGAAGRLHCDVGMFLGARAEGDLPDAATAAASAGLKVYLDATFGPLRLTDLGRLESYVAAWPRTKPMVFHAEGTSVAVAIALGAAWDRPVHLCHISRAAEIRLIRQAKERGLTVTCEVAPHHLFLTDEDAARLGALGDMRPMLARPSDVASLWENIAVVDMIATDHAPHTVGEKASAKPPPGVPGLETSLALMLTAVADGRLSMERLVEMMYTTPQRIFCLPSQPETWTEVDTDERWVIPASGFYTRCGWSPFAGMPVQGRVRRVVLRGDVVYVVSRGVVGPPRGQVLF
jgi:carbamoyl-phosphate synthase/aspartate carbamoyltransferase/dihydroorotase